VKRQHPNMTKLHRTLTAKERQVFDAPVFAHVATLDPDGSPQISAVWVMLDGDDIILNTAVGRTKARNLARDGRVAVSVTDPNDPYRNISVKGHVVQTIGEEQGAGAGINALAKKYIGQDVYPFRADGERRVQYRVAIDAVSGWGDD
jgi:PPOX class probable F420-dependent enzyme